MAKPKTTSTEPKTAKPAKPATPRRTNAQRARECTCESCAAIREMLTPRQKLQMELLEHAFVHGGLVLVPTKDKSGQPIIILACATPNGVMPLARLFAGHAFDEVEAPEGMVETRYVGGTAQA